MSSIFAPTPAETTLVHQIFLQADPQKLGVVTGDAAVKVFDRAKLSPALLADIWAMADEENNGWLSKKGAAKAVRLIGWAQQGRKPSADLLEKPGPLAKLEGINTIAPQNTGMSLPKSPLVPFPALTPQDHEKYLGIFQRAGPVNGLLSGEKSRDIFLKSKLPNEQLVQIWNLADTQDRGALDSADFSIGMFFINGLMSKTISFIPTSLPPGLYQQAGGRVASHLSGSSGSFSPIQTSFTIQPRSTAQLSKAIQPNYTGMSNSSSHSRPAPALPARPPAANSPFHPPPQAAPVWDVTPADKANFDTWFDGLDTQKMGFIEGDVAVPFMLQSGLPGDILATVWDLADVHSDGRLTRDGFAVAMHLIQKKLGGVEVPEKLPSSLIPPSMRPQASQVSTQPHREPVRDLFSFDDSPPLSAVSPNPTGGFSTLQPQQTGTFSTLSAQHTGARSPQNDPFLSSNAPMHTGTTTRNFLDDDEPHAVAASPPLQDKSAEIGNAKNQFSSTSRSLDAARAERVALEQNLAEQASQLSSLQTQLASAKVAYETEVKLLSTLKDRHGIQSTEMQKTREELIRAESDLSALKVEKAEIEGAFMRDKEDVREMQRRMVATGQHADNLKVEVEKIKKEAKQQKGMLAIAKKQLSTKEADRLKAEKELEDVTAELTAITTDRELVERATTELELAPPVAVSPRPVFPERIGSVDTLSFAAAQPLPATPDLGSPAISIKSNNPFDRFKTGGSTPRSQSPFAVFSTPQPESQDVFGGNIFANQPETDKEHSVEGLPYDSAELKPESVGLPWLKETNGSARSQEDLPSPVTANESEFFHTPPTSARNLSPAPEVTLFPAIDDFTAHFTSSLSAAEKAEKPGNDHSEFDSAFNLDTQVKELDIEESDSDSDSDSDNEDEDEVPLSQVKQNVVAAQKATTPKEPERMASFDDVFGSPQPEPKAEEEKEKKIKKVNAEPLNTFDNIFNSPAPAVQTNGARKLTESTASDPTQTASPEPFRAPSAAPAISVAGVDVFDETLNKLSSQSSARPHPPSQQFSFDAAFDDNFDFAAAKGDFTPALVEPTQFQKPATTTFDDIFTSPSAVNGHASEEPSSFSQTEDKPAEVPSTPTPTFDDVFAGSPSSNTPPSAAFAPVAETSAKSNTQTPSQSPPTPSQSTNPFPSSSPAHSPQAASPHPSNLRSPSPLPDRLPPVRAASPKPRLSTSSSKDGEKQKDSTTRHSKLSIRLPFGRKKKQQQQQQHEPMPPPPIHLSPHTEQVERVLTPAVDDDVEPVKQLTSMGFSRTQAIVALEKHGYDVQLALNSLLPTAA